MNGKASAAPLLSRLMYSPVNYWVVFAMDLIGPLVFLAIGFQHYAGPPASIAAAVVIGFLSWGLLEYTLHRFVLHGRSSIARQGHVQHHADPTALISTPMFMLLALFVVTWLLVGLVAPADVAAFYICGLYTCYNYFVVVHHLQHHRPQDLARVAYVEQLERMHHMHHERQSVNFGISTTVWDRVFGTYRPLG